MKKQVKRLLSVGLCLALGLSVGGGLAACKDSGDNPPPVDTSPSPYYLAGSGNLFLGTATGEGDDKVGGEWYEKYADAESIPEAIHFVRSSTDSNIHTITVDLYADNEFGILTAGKGWTGQMGYNIVAESEDEYFVEGGGYTPKNIKVAEAGNYTITLTVSDGATTLTYERNGDAPKLPVAVSGVTLDKSSLTLEVGGEATLTATVAPEDADDKTVTWSSDKESVATVVGGKVTAVAEGEATITATAGGKSATCKVVVAAAGSIVEVTGVTLNKQAVTLHVGDTETLTATVAPENATNKTVAWSVSSSDNAASVVDGVITAVKPGTATVTVTSGDKTDTCEVTVVADYYLAGASRSPAFENKSWAAINKVSEIPTGILFTQDATDANKYTLEIDLYGNDAFVILPSGLGWDGKIAGGEGVADIGNVNADTEITLANVGSGSNLNVAAAGKYVFTLTFEEGVPSLSYNRIGDAAELAWTYNIYAHGNWDPNEKDDEGNLVWKASPRIGTETLDKDNLTLTGTIEIGVGAQFGFITSDSTAATPSQIGWGGKDKMTLAEGVTGIDLTGGDATCTVAGTYTVKVTLNVDGGFVSIEFTAYQAPAEA